jgi:hypothetical protein
MIGTLTGILFEIQIIERSLGARKPEDTSKTERNPLVLILFTLLKISIKLYGAKQTNYKMNYTLED